MDLFSNLYYNTFQAIKFTQLQYKLGHELKVIEIFS